MIPQVSIHDVKGETHNGAVAVDDVDCHVSDEQHFGSGHRQQTFWIIAVEKTRTEAAEASAVSQWQVLPSERRTKCAAWFPVDAVIAVKDDGRRFSGSQV